ncbi:restriction endonuclease subunit S [Akkermansiaceae bacterium]|nr:restriction endonuclease subunit S [Akkermansiaceae bacterium]MDB4560893.1 restriction endonuclease subunit S [Akkermansiaceae bacterium]
MELKEGYKQTKVGVIPDDWKLSKLGSLGEVRGRVGWKGYTKKDLVDSGAYAIGGKHIDFANRLDLSDPTFLSEAKFSESPEIMVEKGDLLIAQRGTIGKLVHIECEIGKATINPSLVILRLRKASPAFVWSYLTSESGQRQIFEDLSSTSVPMISQAQIENFVAPMPTKAEQEAIAEALSDADALIESLEQLIAKKRQIKQGAMQELLTGKKRLPGFSGEWEVKTLGSLFTLSAGRSKSNALSGGEGFIVMDMGSVSSDGATIASKRTASADDLLDTGDLVMPKDDIGGGNIIGRVAYIDRNHAYVLGDHVYRLRRMDNRVEPKFFYYLINSAHVNRSLRTKVAGSAQLGLGRKPVLEELLHFASNEDEQTAIATILSDMDAEIAALETKLAKARQVKQGMMQELLTGNIRLIQSQESHA